MVQQKSPQEPRLEEYSIELMQEADGSYVASVPQLSGLLAAGPDPNAAIETLRGVFSEWIADAIAHSEQIPEPYREEEFSGRILVRLPRAMHAQLARESDRQNASINGLVIGAVSAYLASVEVQESIEVQLREIKEMIARSGTPRIIAGLSQWMTPARELEQLQGMGMEAYWSSPSVENSFVSDTVHFSAAQDEVRVYPRSRVHCGMG